ncbi:MAG TPA: serine hydrolase domain-containing protein [Bacteroidia bacterium]|nr:serine hydrolase domain-containing protein [Bacteroidia bacterium]
MQRYFIFSLIIALLSACGEDKPVRVADTVPVDSTAYFRKLIGAEAKEFQLDTFFQNRFVEGTFSGCVLVAQRGIVLYEEAFGWENHENRDSLSLESSFQLASVSKQFTAAAVLLLVQEGKLKLTDSIRKFFPLLPYYNVTVHQLLTHRAGLDKYTNICDNHYRKQGIDPPPVYTNDSVISLFSLLNVKAIHKPGEKFDYSNTGYVVLATLVEHLSATSFHAFMKTRFFDPLGMNHTWINNDGAEHTHCTRGYYKSWNRWDEGFLDQVSGDKGVYSSVGDMWIWDRALRNGKVLSPEMQSAAYKGYSEELTDKKRWNYGYGWRTVDFPDGAKAVFHNGWWHGYTSTFYRGLTDDVTIIILCNKFNRGIYNVQPLLTILGAHHFDPEPEETGTDSADVTGGSNQTK